MLVLVLELELERPILFHSLFDEESVPGAGVPQEVPPPPLGLYGDNRSGLARTPLGIRDVTQ